MSLPSAITTPQTYKWPSDHYIVEGGYFTGPQPFLRQRAQIKAAFTKAFNRVDESLKGNSYHPPVSDPVGHVYRYFDVFSVYKITGELIFDHRSPIMTEYALGRVTRKEVIEAIDW